MQNSLGFSIESSKPFEEKFSIHSHPPGIGDGIGQFVNPHYAPRFYHDVPSTEINSLSAVHVGVSVDQRNDGADRVVQEQPPVVEKKEDSTTLDYVDDHKFGENRGFLGEIGRFGTGDRKAETYIGGFRPIGV